MMKNKIIIAFLLSMPFLSMAQYTGPNSNKTLFTVEELVANAKAYSKAKKLVTVQGFITQQLPELHMYVFEDTSGKINVEIEPDDLPPRSFDDNDKVLLIGIVKSKKNVNTFLASKTILLNMRPPMPPKPPKDVEVTQPDVPMDSMDPNKSMAPEKKEMSAPEIKGKKEGTEEEVKEGTKEGDQ